MKEAVSKLLCFGMGHDKSIIQKVPPLCSRSVSHIPLLEIFHPNFGGSAKTSSYIADLALYKNDTPIVFVSNDFISKYAAFHFKTTY
ncbi:hypothetical protein CEXT_436281 [Caerostris extrusa]|uniref:Uncharacterized protein n=1 Tax=Caerostris extrusa TaxID=172846 RepID=A0AAV4MY06_CAEEX|nr:hypothetical protein CEXT_436281 [Caerostris extrusa]